MFGINTLFYFSYLFSNRKPITYTSDISYPDLGTQLNNGLIVVFIGFEQFNHINMV